MAGRQTFRILIAGKLGSGKSTLARQIIQRMRRYRHLVVVNCKREFAVLVQGRYTVGEEGDPTPALRKHRRKLPGSPSPQGTGLPPESEWSQPTYPVLQAQGYSHSVTR